MYSLSRDLPGVQLFSGLHLAFGVSRLVFLGIPQGVHDRVGQNVGLAGHHAVADIVEMEEVVHEVADDSKAFGGRVGVAVSSEFPSLKAPKSLPGLGREVGAHRIKPSNGLESYLIALGMICEGELAMRDEIGKYEGRRRSLGVGDERGGGGHCGMQR